MSEWEYKNNRAVCICIVCLTLILATAIAVTKVYEAKYGTTQQSGKRG